MQLPNNLKAQSCQVKSMTEVSGARFRHTPLPFSGRVIRLLNIQPRPETAPETTLRCTLLNVNLNDRPDYFALSYVWGDPTDTIGILVNGKEYDVTVSCHAALYRIQETKYSSIWVDAICINQEDDDEKSRQIPLMRDIYTLAKEVVIWLGSNKTTESGKREEEHLGFGLLEGISSDPNFSENDVKSFAEFSIPGEDPTLCWRSMVEICKSPWFDRLWCHQEAILSSRATLLGQYYSIPWSALVVAMIIVSRDVNPSSPFLINDSQLSQWVAIVNPLLKSNAVVRCVHSFVRMRYNRGSLAEEGKKKDFSLLNILIATRTFKCYDSRDRIFAILGLAEDDLGILPSYSQTREELFTEVTWTIMRKTQSLEALSLAGTGASPTASRSRLPSWVVDWDPHYEQATPLDYHNYRAAPLPASYRVDFTMTLSILEVFGAQIDTVMARLSDNTKGGDFWRKASMTLWRSRFEKYPGGCDPFEAYIRTVTADRAWDHLGAQKGGRLTEDLVLQYKDLAGDGARLAMEMQPGGRYNGTTVSEMKGLYACLLGLMSEVTHMRAFFISRTGYMGIGPHTIEEHDIICIVPGCNVPLLIRKVDNQLFLVGECFVWGLMDGEVSKGAENQVFRLS
ncbi:heterokaryon incompatibility protein-domain-containing protein [Rhexocercosporidium sp. MPI-PUGE-AT-0058]|nr:heterokaryon incompatibility protein-domain-containing protein [Rhexocercosporidium sp. MPI-PUGE-AT-0058]